MFCKEDENLSDQVRKYGDKICPLILRRFATLKLNQKLSQSSAFLTLGIVVASNKKEETTNLQLFSQKDEVFA